MPRRPSLRPSETNMKYIRQYGQVTLLPLISLGASFIIAFTGSFWAQRNYIDNAIAKSDEENTTIVQRVATLEEAIKTLKQDNFEIKADLKTLLQRTK